MDFSSTFNTIIPNLHLSVDSKAGKIHIQYLYHQHWSPPSKCPPPTTPHFTNDCTSTDSSVKHLRFTNDTTNINLIQDSDVSACRSKVKQLTFWCSHNQDFWSSPVHLPGPVIFQSEEGGREKHHTLAAASLNC